MKYFENTIVDTYSKEGMDKYVARKLDEFCSNGDLEPYRNILKEIFQKIMDNNCQISAIYDSDISSHSTDYNENRCRIKISLRKKYKHPVHIIWSILHEFGHHLVGAISKKDEFRLEIRRENEFRAWKEALNEVCLYKELKDFKADFENYRDECLNTYN